MFISFKGTFMRIIKLCCILGFLLFVLIAPNVEAQTHYTILTKESYAKYFMKHPMHDWEATSNAVKGSIDLATDLASAKVNITIPVTSFDSHNSNRDSHMAETVESYIYPTVNFTSTKITRLITPGDTANTPEQQKGVWQVEGIINFHGVSKKVVVPVTVKTSEKQLAAEGEFESTLIDFDIKPPSLMMVATKDWLKISFSLIAEISKSASD